MAKKLYETLKREYEEFYECKNSLNPLKRFVAAPIYETHLLDVALRNYKKLPVREGVLLGKVMDLHNKKEYKEVLKLLDDEMK